MSHRLLLNGDDELKTLRHAIISICPSVLTSDTREMAEWVAQPGALRNALTGSIRFPMTKP